MGKKSEALIIIPTVDMTLLEWISSNKRVVYRQSRADLSDLFGCEYATIEDRELRHIVLLSAFDGTQDSLTSLGIVADDSIKETDIDELEQLSYPNCRQIDGTKYNLFLINVDTDSLQSPSLQIDAKKLQQFLQDRNLTAKCSVVDISELRAEGIITGLTVESSDEDVVSVADLLNKSDDKRLNGEPHLVEEQSIPVRMRERNELLRVSFNDGTVICDRKAVNTFVQAIEKIGPDRVAALNLTYCNTPLLSRSYSSNENYAKAQKEVGDGWLLFTQGPIAMKYITLKNISDQLSLGLKIEHGTDIEPITQEITKQKRSTKNNLKVTFADGLTIESSNSRTTFVKTITRIGIDKVQRLKLNIAGTPLFSTLSLTNCIQEKVSDNVYITIPNGTKRMYKYLTVIAAMTHQRITIQIV